MRIRTTFLALLASTAFAGAAFAADEPSGQSDNANVGRVKAIDPITGQTREPTAAELAALQVKANRLKVAPKARMGGTVLPQTHEQASRMVKKLKNGAEMLPASEDSMSNVVMVRNADGTFSTFHADATTTTHAQEAASE